MSVRRAPVLPLWEKIIERKIARTKEMGCFVAGTLVHTSEGLKPIEQIKVGDLVLSKPESGEGEVSYQPVTRTFRYEDRELYLLPFTELDPVTGRVVTGKTEYVAVTGAHPIWVTHFRQYRWNDDQKIITHVNAWVSVEEVYKKCWHAYWSGPEEQLTEPETFALLQNGAPAIINRPEPILKGLNEDEGVEFHDGENWLDGCEGRTIQLGDEKGVVFSPSTALGRAAEYQYDYTGYDLESEMSVVKRSGGHLPVRRTVFNLEVAHNHSYFVGELGLWVHNTSGIDPVTPLPLRTTENLKVIVGEEAEIAFKAALDKTPDGKGLAVMKDISVGSGKTNGGQAQGLFDGSISESGVTSSGLTIGPRTADQS